MVFTTLGILRLKKLMIIEILIVWILCIYVLIIEEKDANKYLIFDSTDENKELLKKYNDFFDGIRGNIKEVCSDEFDYEKGYMKIKFNSDDNLPLNKTLQFHIMTITIRFVFREDGKLYPQVSLDDNLYKS